MTTFSDLVMEARERVLRDALAAGTEAELRALDVRAYRGEAGELLGRVSDAVRGPGTPDRRGADLIEAAWRKLRAA